MKFPLEFIFLPEQFHDRSRNNHPAACAVPCIDLAQGIETHQKTRQRGMAKLLCGNPLWEEKLSFDFLWMQSCLHQILINMFIKLYILNLYFVLLTNFTPCLIVLFV